MDTLIISEKILKDNSPITDDTVVKEFIPYISIVQSIYIEPVLGEELLDELKLQVKNNNLTPLNSALILKIAPALAYFSIYQGLPFHWASIVNKGITIRESENSKAVVMNDLAQLRRWIRNDAETLLSLAVSYLCNCRSNYPLWKPDKKYCTNGCGSGTGNSQFEAGIYFPNK